MGAQAQTHQADSAQAGKQGDGEQIEDGVGLPAERQQHQRFDEKGENPRRQRVPGPASEKYCERSRSHDCGKIGNRLRQRAGRRDGGVAAADLCDRRCVGTDIAGQAVELVQPREIRGTLADAAGLGNHGVIVDFQSDDHVGGDGKGVDAPDAVADAHAVDAVLHTADFSAAVLHILADIQNGMEQLVIRY